MQILMLRIKLRITIIIGQFTLIRCYNYTTKKHTQFFYKALLAVSKPVLSYAADTAIIKTWEMV